jgi:putative transposase
LTLGLFLICSESRDKVKIKIEINVKGSGQECPLHNTHKKTGLIECPSVTDNSQGPKVEYAMSSLARGYNYHRRLPHFQKADRAIFLTFRKLNREPFAANARNVILQHCLHDDGKRFILHAAVVMPSHVHLLLTPLRDEQGWPHTLPAILKLIKGVSARSVNKLLGVSGPVWQDESFDHVLRSDESFAEELEYIRQNPVRAGLVTRAEEYSWLWIA